MIHTDCCLVLGWTLLDSNRDKIRRNEDARDATTFLDRFLNILEHFQMRHFNFKISAIFSQSKLVQNWQEQETVVQVRYMNTSEIPRYTAVYGLNISDHSYFTVDQTLHVHGTDPTRNPPSGEPKSTYCLLLILKIRLI